MCVLYSIVWFQVAMIKLVPHRITLSQLLNQQIFPGKAIYVLMDQDPGKFGTFMKYIQGVFFNWDPPKSSKFQIT